MQYSKPFYDTNVKGFETELRKITSSSPQFCKQPCIGNNSSSQNLVTTITRSPIKPLPHETLPATKEELKINRRLNLANRGSRPRFVHHITTNFRNYANAINISQGDVDSLKKLNAHTIQIIGGLRSEAACQEIHAAGFSCIEEHKFQYTSSFMRRAQSFSNSSLLIGFESESSMSSEPASAKQVCVIDYIVSLNSDAD